MVFVPSGAYIANSQEGGAAADCVVILRPESHSLFGTASRDIEDFRLSRNEVENVVSLINRALHKEGISGVRIERIRCMDTGRILGTATPTSTLQDLPKCHMVLKAARSADNTIGDIAPQQKWKRIRIHNIPLPRHMGKARDGGLKKLREELEAENTGVHISGGWAGQRSVPDSRQTGTAHPRW